jgi:hypothetical protein
MNFMGSHWEWPLGSLRLCITSKVSVTVKTREIDALVPGQDRRREIPPSGARTTSLQTTSLTGPNKAARERVNSFRRAQCIVEPAQIQFGFSSCVSVSHEDIE